MTRAPAPAGSVAGPEAPYTDEELAFLKACSTNPPRNAMRMLREIEQAREARTAALRQKATEGAR